MKKTTSVVAMVATIFTIVLAGVLTAHAQDTEIKLFQEKKLVKSVVFAVGVPKYYTDTNPEGVPMDAKPFIQDSRTFMPIRFLSNALGVPDERIAWEGETKTVTLTPWKHVRMTVGSKWIAVRSADNYVGESYTIDVSPILKAEEGRTYLPARYVAEALGYEVEWDEATQTVLCWPRGEAKPDVAAVKQAVQRERDLLAGKAPEGYYVTKKGYVVPKPENTKMKIEDAAADVDLTLVVYLPHAGADKEWVLKNKPDQLMTPEMTQLQLKQVEEILAQKHGREIARSVVEYAGQKKDREGDLSIEGKRGKEFPLPGGGKITVLSYKGTPYITIDVWRV